MEAITEVLLTIYQVKKTTQFAEDNFMDTIHWQKFTTNDNIMENKNLWCRYILFVLFVT